MSRAVVVGWMQSPISVSYFSDLENGRKPLTADLVRRIVVGIERAFQNE